MKLAHIASFLLAFGAGALPQVHAQAVDEAAFPPRAAVSGTALIVSGAEKFAPLLGRSSIDGQFAIGFTVRPKQGAAPVDWSLWKENDPAPFLRKYNWTSKNAKYAAADCVIDLWAKKNLGALTLKEVYFPQKPHGSFGVAWGRDRRGSRFLMVNSNSALVTEDVLLAEISSGKLHETSVQPLLDDAVKPLLKGLFAENASRYGVAYSPHLADIRAFFTGGSIDIPFHGTLPKATIKDTYATGQVTLHVAMNSGTLEADVKDSDVKKVEAVADASL